MGVDVPAVADARLRSDHHIYDGIVGPRQPELLLSVDHLLEVPLFRADHTWRSLTVGEVTC